ncbi:MAG: cytochrome P450, partial [Anaerolineales bacterium]|nr:cytochrome P450 [Anaerolineales bacterium]
MPGAGKPRIQWDMRGEEQSESSSEASALPVNSLMTRQPPPDLGLRVLRAWLQSGSPLGPLQVMADEIGYFFQIPLPGFNPYVVFGPQANRTVLVTQREKLLWRNTDPVTDLLRRGVLVVDGNEHEHYRKLMEPALHPAKLPGYAEMMIAQAQRVSDRWQEGEAVDLLVESRKIALLIIFQALFSEDIGDDLPHLWQPILKAIEFISPAAWIVWRRIPRPSFATPLRQLDAYLYGLIAKRRDGQPRPDMLQALIDAGLSDDVIRDQMLTMLIAGHDTSTALLAWVFVLLGRHRQVMAELQEEVARDDKSALLDAVIKEALRLYPPIHIGNRRVAEPLELEEGTIPAGARLFYSIYLTQRDRRIWEAAEEFRPQRFLGGRHTPPFAYVPFGGGPRACIGAAFGQLEARLVLTFLLRHFTFEP